MSRARTISPVAIARAGAWVARRAGFDAVTVRAVATRLGVTPMALYRHVGSAAGLRSATLEFVLLEVPPPPVDGSVASRLRDFALGARPVLTRYPGVADAVLVEWVHLVQGARIMEALLATAAAHTRRGDEQVDIANAVFVYILMRAIAERAVLARGNRRSLPVVRAHPERFPRLLAAQQAFGHIDVDRHFAVGLDALLDGLLGGRA
ncbi:MAG: TetR/AcrR family transcriptional regulator [Acidimicrobiia bacterium]